MPETRAEVARRRRISMIWLVPIVTLLSGLWMVVYAYRSQGPEITIVFSTAEGIEAGKTKLKARSVEVGLVEAVRLDADLESVVVTAKLDPSAMPLLREDTQFWVVRPRVEAGGISGLGTILSGGYIELAPGSGPEGRRRFEGLEDVPVTPVGTPGLKFTLLSGQAGSVNTGDPILYKDFRVGRVESSEFDVASQQIRYGAFIDAPYDELVTTATRFWNASGVAFSATADGIELNTGSLQSLLLGGVSFGLPEGLAPGDPVDDGATFSLFPDYDSVNERPYGFAQEYVVRFARSIRGLRAGAPVEYRGLRAGRVERVLLEEAVAVQTTEGGGQPIPVLIRLEPGRLALGDSQQGVETLRSSIETGVARGLRATLSTGNLLTGSLYVALDLYRDDVPAEMGTFAGRPSIPTISTGLEGMEQKVVALLDKLNAMPLEELLVSAEGSLQEVRRTVAEVRMLLSSGELQSLPSSLEASLSELDRTLRRLGSLAATLEEQPNSLVFPREAELDPEPTAGVR